MQGRFDHHAMAQMFRCDRHTVRRSLSSAAYAQQLTQAILMEMILEKLESTLIRLHMRLTKTFEEEFLKSQKEIAEALFSICPGFKKDRNNANAIYAYLKSKKFTEWQASDNYLTRNEVKTLVETCNKLVKRKKFEETLLYKC